MEHVCANQLKVPLKPLLRRKRRITTAWASLDNSRYPNQQQEHKLNLSVLRFTLGEIQEIYRKNYISIFFEILFVEFLCRYSWIGRVLLAQMDWLRFQFTSDVEPLRWVDFTRHTGTASARRSFEVLTARFSLIPCEVIRVLFWWVLVQRSECLGLSLGVFSVALPYLGKFLKGAILTDQVTIPEGNKQIFVMSEHLTEMLKEDLAWGSFVLLKNTNSMAVLISVQDALCIRGYWNVPEGASKGQMLDWFERQIQQIGLFDLKDTLYFPVSADSGLWDVLPEGTRSLLVQPVTEEGPELSANEDTKKARGFILLASSISYAYNDKDQAWIDAIARKFRVKRSRNCSLLE